MLIKIGSTGESVKKLQKALGLTEDGSFGPNTEKKVKEFQASKGLKADGIVGEGTWSKLFPSETPVNEVKTEIPKSGSLNIDKLKGVIPDSVLSQIPDTAAKFNITTNLRLAHFLAQCAHESGSFKFVSENLNYSADGLKKTFGKYFPGTLNESYAKNPEKIASRVYANRMGNGDEASKDGWKYRGAGFIQLTGKSNYQVFDKLVEDDIMSNPQLVATKYPLMSAAFFFDKNGLWPVCDKGSDEATIISVTKRVNGGTNGLQDRIAKFKKYYNLLK